MTRAAAAGAVLLGALVLATPAPAAHAPGDRTLTVPTTPIRHLVVVTLESHSFDNLFGTFTGADGFDPRVCLPVDVPARKGRCVRPYRLGTRPVSYYTANPAIFDAQYRDGRMDGFVTAFRQIGFRGRQAMGYYDQEALATSWSLARQYVLFDRFFAAAKGGTVWNHLYAVTATPGNPAADSIPTRGFHGLATIFDRLAARGISWKYYVQNYDPSVTFRTPDPGTHRAQPLRVPLLSFGRYVDRARLIDDPRIANHIVDLSQYYVDLARGTLPAVAYVAPAGVSEQPPGRVEAGERLIRALVRSLQRSSAWSSSAFLWMYDDWGGFYDHVPPPRLDAYGDGFRVPAVLVSPYAPRGVVNHETFDSTSILRFIEDNWQLRSLARRDAEAHSIASAFDFAQAPRAAQLGAGPNRISNVTPERTAVYLAYGIGGLAAVAAIAAGAAGEAIRRRRPGAAQRTAR